MKLLSILLLAALSGCASVPWTPVHTLVDGPVHVSGIRGDTLQILNHGPAHLGYEYRTDDGTHAQGEIGVGVLLEFDVRQIREICLRPLQGDSSEVDLYVRPGAGAALRLTKE